MESTSAQMTMTIREEINRIRDLKKTFRLSCSQLIHINLTEKTEDRYNHSQQVNCHSYRYILRLKLCTLEGV